MKTGKEYGLGGKRKEYLDAVLALIYPPRCVACDEVLPYENRVRAGRKAGTEASGTEAAGKEVWDGVHPECQKKLQVITEPVCMKCGQPVDHMRKEFCFDCEKKHHRYIQGKSIFLYKGDMKQSMYRFKYAGRREYAGVYARIASKNYGAWIRQHGIEVFIPVPMYKKKQRRRGYNQAEVFAKALSEECGIPCRADLLERVKNTRPQKQLNDIERKNNLKNAFHVSKDIVKYKYILLIDDIYTTGSTIDAAAEALQLSGVRNIYFLSICIGKGI